ncbi:MAG: hypothetical protein ABI539_02305 [Acidobacteriota bacterium]
MKLLSKTLALKKLALLREGFAQVIKGSYESRAKSCAACTTPGACCLDEHFVNVRITTLEAVAIRKTIDQFDERRRLAVYERVDQTVVKFGLSKGDDVGQQTYACPLFEAGRGCLVHETAKPLPCIHHACYEKRADLPPDRLLDEGEEKIARLNARVYGRKTAVLPLPVMISRTAVSGSGPARPNNESHHKADEEPTY